jgi:hypothetical protein
MSELGGSCVVCLVATLGLGLVIGSIVLIVFSCIALSHNSRDFILDQCPDADIWVWLLVVTILQVLSIGSTGWRNAKTENISNSQLLIYLGLSLVLQIALASWGGPMIMSNCAFDKLEGTYVWYLSYIHFMIQLVVISLLSIIGFGTLIFICIISKEDSDKYTNPVARV